MRIVFENGVQKQFLKTLLAIPDLSVSTVAQEASVSTRTIRDWKREKFNADYDRVLLLSKKYKIPLPRHKILDERWHLPIAASKGGHARFKKHGAVGTIEDRKRGGLVSQARRRSNPEKYRLLGCIVRKIFQKPKYSSELAEVIGILLGDGGITNYQVTVSLDRKVDYEYAIYVSNLLYKVFEEKPTWFERASVIELKLSGANLIDMLEELGLERGNKIKHQVSIPSWIFQDKKYEFACMRGLFDTDGSIYHHKKLSGTYIGWTFTSLSLPLIMGVERILKHIPLRYSVTYGRNVYIYSLDAVQKYMAIVGSSNPKNVRKVKQHIKERWLSGRKHAFGVRAGGNPSRVRISPSPI